MAMFLIQFGHILVAEVDRMSSTLTKLTKPITHVSTINDGVYPFRAPRRERGRQAGWSSEDPVLESPLGVVGSSRSTVMVTLHADTICNAMTFRLSRMIQLSANFTIHITAFQSKENKAKRCPDRHRGENTDVITNYTTKPNWMLCQESTSTYKRQRQLWLSKATCLPVIGTQEARNRNVQVTSFSPWPFKLSDMKHLQDSLQPETKTLHHLHPQNHTPAAQAGKIPNTWINSNLSLWIPLIRKPIILYIGEWHSVPHPKKNSNLIHLGHVPSRKTLHHAAPPIPASDELLVVLEPSARRAGLRACIENGDDLALFFSFFHYVLEHDSGREEEDSLVFDKRKGMIRRVSRRS
ncbi:uncharacterized protein CLUP02_16387 [Colletotrichum lupini]|uniref:Uncharacterized protein n=1 Tax=Colletotrichum lupini TaxID=145971 RepID=A0A9Q8T8C2_9PEZI|nr:uncharacterized protein CLUP02_16387 [Colletotrichum lupini]UQC90855.1 hypothetical protein CLUP02_16387 [Colletotrichum lupini]